MVYLHVQRYVERHVEWHVQRHVEWHVYAYILVAVSYKLYCYILGIILW